MFKKRISCDRCGRFAKKKDLKQVTTLVADRDLSEGIKLTGRSSRMLLHEGCAKQEIERCVFSDYEEALIDQCDKVLIDFAKDCCLRKEKVDRAKESVAYVGHTFSLGMDLGEE